MTIYEDLIRFDYFRAVMYSSLYAQLPELKLSGIGVEFGGSNGIIQQFCGAAVRFENPSRDWPQWDVCSEHCYEKYWDVIVADQVLEHTTKPWLAIQNWGRHCQTAIFTVPFLYRVHALDAWSDFWRMTPSAIRMLARENGFSKVDVRTWGNTTVNKWACEFHHGQPVLDTIPEAEWRRQLAINQDDNPFMIWAILQK